MPPQQPSSVETILKAYGVSGGSAPPSSNVAAILGAYGVAEPSVSRLVDNPYKGVIGFYARQQGVDPELVARVVFQESANNPKAVSPKGAKGLMQLMDATAKELGVSDPFNPEQNIRGGVTYLKGLLDQYGGDEAKALAAYNAGPTAVAKHNGVPPYPETQKYVATITAGRGQQAADPASTPGTPEPAIVSSQPEKPPPTWRDYAGAIAAGLPTMLAQPGLARNFTPPTVMVEGARQVGRGATGIVTAADNEGRMAGASDIIEGAMSFGSPLLIPAALEAAGVTAATVGAAMAATEAARVFAEKAGLSPEGQRLAGNAAGLTVAGYGGSRILKAAGIDRGTVDAKTGQFLRGIVDWYKGKTTAQPPRGGLTDSTIEGKVVARERGPERPSAASEAVIRGYPEPPPAPPMATPPPAAPVVPPAPLVVAPEPAAPTAQARQVPPWPPEKPQEQIVREQEAEFPKPVEPEPAPEPTIVSSEPEVGPVEAVVEPPAEPLGPASQGRADFEARAKARRMAAFVGGPFQPGQDVAWSFNKEYPQFVPGSKVIASGPETTLVRTAGIMGKPSVETEIPNAMLRPMEASKPITDNLAGRNPFELTLKEWYELTPQENDRALRMMTPSQRAAFYRHQERLGRGEPPDPTDRGDPDEPPNPTRLAASGDAWHAVRATNKRINENIARMQRGEPPPPSEAVEPAGDVDVSFDPAEFEAPPAEPVAPVEAQPILPGTEGVREQNIPTPEFELPYSLTPPKHGLGKKIETPELPNVEPDAPKPEVVIGELPVEGAIVTFTTPGPNGPMRRQGKVVKRTDDTIEVKAAQGGYYTLRQDEFRVVEPTSPPSKAEAGRATFEKNAKKRGAKK